MCDIVTSSSLSFTPSLLPPLLSLISPPISPSSLFPSLSFSFHHSRPFSLLSASLELVSPPFCHVFSLSFSFFLFFPLFSSFFLLFPLFTSLFPVFLFSSSGIQLRTHFVTFKKQFSSFSICAHCSGRQDAVASLTAFSIRHK